MKRRRFCFPCHGELVSFIREEKVKASYLDVSFLKKSVKGLRLSERDKKLLYEVKRIIESHAPDEPLHLRQLCRKIGINEHKLKTGFRQLFSYPPCGYFLELKMSQAKKLLLEPDSTVNGVAYTLGYQYPSNFCVQFKRKFGMTAGEWRRG